MQHRYSGFECNESDDKVSQPADLNIQLKPHQLTSVAKMTALEAGRIAYDLPNGSYEVDAVSIGILADKAGYGKTITVLGLIASDHEIHVQTSVVQSSFALNIGQAFCIRKTNNYLDTVKDLMLDTTLVIVKGGIVFQQWSKAIRENTSMTCTMISNDAHISCSRELLAASIRGKNIVLVSDSMFKKFIYASFLWHWKRVVVDEADDIFCPSMPDVISKFTWFVTATPERLKAPKNKGFVRNMCPQMLFYKSRELYRFLTVKNEDSYILQSFDVPSFTTTRYLCQETYVALCEFASPQLLELLNANDLQGALRCLDGTDRDDVNRLIIKKSSIEVENIRIMIEAVQRQVGSDRDKQARLLVLNERLRAKEKNIESMHRRLKELAEENCPICCERPQDPISLSCLHIFCGECLMGYLRSRLTSDHIPSMAVCPLCRMTIKREEIYRLTCPASSELRIKDPIRKHLTKDQAILKIVKSNPRGKFIIFCNYVTTFYQLSREFVREKISHSELKGNSDLKTLARFREGGIQVIMLNSRDNGSGSDISCATDMIFYMRLEDTCEDDQALARAQRVGRQSPLRVHRLYHKAELKTDITEYVVAESDSS